MDQREYATAYSKVMVPDERSIYEPLIKPLQKNMLKKQFKIYSLLRFHKIFENNRYFGKNISMMLNQGCQNIISDFFQFSTESLKESSKYHQQQMKMI